MSIQFSVASVFVHRALRDANFARYDDRETARIAARTELVVDPEFAAAFPARQGSEVEVRLAGGEKRRARLADVRSLGGYDVRARFPAAAAVLGASRVAEIEERLAELRRLTDVAPLVRLLASPVGTVHI